MIVVEERCAFLDVHRDMVMACARLPDDGEQVQQFSTTSKGLLALADWLVERGVTLVGMEATGQRQGRRCSAASVGRHSRSAMAPTKSSARRSGCSRKGP